MRFWKNALLSVIPLENLTPGRRKSLPGIKKKLKIDCLLSVIPFDILKTTKIIENFSEISRIFSKFINFWRIFFALRNPQWFLDARSHLEVKIIARNPANLVDFFQKFTEIDCLLSVNPLDILKTTKKLQFFKKFMRFWKKYTF